jgi:hypothetical protein
MTRPSAHLAAIAGEAGPRAVFSAHGREYRWSDVIAAAVAYGDWGRIRRQAAADRRPAGREAVTAWRRQQKLLSADETLAWLDHWCVEMTDLERHLGVRAPAAGTDLDRAAWIEAVCSGAHRHLAWGLAERVALAPSPPDAATELDLAELERLDRAFERRKQEIECSDAVARLIAANAAEWVRVGLRRLTLSDLDAAREAVLCVRVDGLSLADVAAIAGAELHEEREFLDELDADWRALISSAAVGELRGPVATSAGHAVMELLDKEFAADDPDVVARARKAAVEQAVARAAAKFTWHERL